MVVMGRMQNRKLKPLPYTRPAYDNKKIAEKILKLGHRWQARHTTTEKAGVIKALSFCASLRRFQFKLYEGGRAGDAE